MKGFLEPLEGIVFYDRGLKTFGADDFSLGYTSENCFRGIIK